MAYITARIYIYKSFMSVAYACRGRYIYTCTYIFIYIYPRNRLLAAVQTDVPKKGQKKDVRNMPPSRMGIVLIRRPSGEAHAPRHNGAQLIAS